MPILDNLNRVFQSADQVMRITSVLASMGLLISTLEVLASRRLLTREGVYASEVLGARGYLLNHRILAMVARLLFSYPATLGLLLVRILALALIIAAPLLPDLLQPIALSVIVITNVALLHRNPFAREGSDQMLEIIFVTLWIDALFANSLIRTICIVFIGMHAVLAYSLSGLTKLRGPKWRSGEAIPEIMSTVTFGQRHAAQLLRRYPFMSRIASWAVMGIETLFCTILLVEWPWSLLYIGVALAFHIANGVLMGLNIFIWAFAATFPALLHISILMAQS